MMLELHQEQKTLIREDLTSANEEFPYNPNGAIQDIAGVTSEDSKVLGMMPHPERAMEFTNMYDWTNLKEKYLREGTSLPVESMNMQMFRNIADYFKGRA